MILTVDWLSPYALDVSVVPLTSVPRANFPTRVELPVGEGGLKAASWAKCDQVTTLRKAHLPPRAFGRVGLRKLAEIEEAVGLALGL